MYLWKAVVAKKKTVILNAFADIHIHDLLWIQQGRKHLRRKYLLHVEKNKCVAELSSRVLLSLFDIFIKTKLQYLLSHFFDHERKKEIPHIFHINKGL